MAAVNVVPLPTERLPEITNPTTVETLTVPLKVSVPVMAVVPVCKTSVPLPERVKLT